MYAVQINIRRLAPLLALLLGFPALAATPAAQAAPAKAPLAKPTPESAAAAEKTLGVIVSALKSDNVPKEIKAGLFGCLYYHSIGEISARVTQTLKINKQINPKDPTQYLLVVAKLCGVSISETQAKPGAAPKPPVRKTPGR